MSFTQNSDVIRSTRTYGQNAKNLYVWVVLCIFERKGERRTTNTLLLWVFNKSLKNMTIPAIIVCFCLFENAYMWFFLNAHSNKIAPILDIYGYFCILSPCDLFELTFSNTENVPRASRSGLTMMPCITVASHTIEISLFHHCYCSRSKYR